MASDLNPTNFHHHHLTTTTTTTTTSFRWPPTHRKIHLKRRKLQYIRLGGPKQRGGRRLFLVKILKKIRLKWLKLKYMCIIKKLKEFYRNMIKDLIEASASIEAYQQRILMETSFTVPVMGISFSNYPSATGSNRPASILF